MLKKVIVDTSVWVALINQRDRHHAWVVEQLAGITSPMLTCEAVVSETWFYCNECNAVERLYFSFSTDSRFR